MIGYVTYKMDACNPEWTFFHEPPVLNLALDIPILAERNVPHDIRYEVSDQFCHVLRRAPIRRRLSFDE